MHSSHDILKETYAKEVWRLLLLTSPENTGCMAVIMIQRFQCVLYH